MQAMEGPVSRETRDGLEAGAAGRGRAFARLVDRRALDRAYRSATLLLGDPQDAEDAVHDAALTAWRRFGDLRDPARFEAWFGRILVNACRDRLRARRRAPVFLDMAPEPVATGDREAVVDRRLALASALRHLSAEHREVLVLRFFEDLTVEDIAERTGARLGTVKSRLHYALRELRAIYGAEDDGGGSGGERRAVR
jgi:RNA polymerase sigma-70 factor (ECF subfamily)